MQDYVSSNKIKENKYKILRMSLLLGTGVDREEMLNNFEDASREIDAMNDEVYLNNIEDKFYDTLKLEDEEKKLSVLVDYIGGRVEQRISLLTDFANVTGYDLQNLPPIKYYDKLDDYTERLGYIKEYLNNINEIAVLKTEIEKEDKKLNECYLNKSASEEYNLKIENTLYDKFYNIFKTLEFFEDTTEENIDDKLMSASKEVNDSKKSLDIFTKSFTTLSGAGISDSEEREYLSYVENAQLSYYNFKEQEYIFKLYKLVLSKYSDYNQIKYKRDEINSILSERVALRTELNVLESDIFGSLYDLLERQYEDINRQSGDIDDIETLTKNINDKKDALNKLELDNQKVEILSLLREFCLLDTYDDISVEMSDVDEDISKNDDVKAEIDAIISGVDTDNELDKKDEFEFDSNDFNFEFDNVDSSLNEEEIDVSDIGIDQEEVIDFDNALDNQVVKVEDAVMLDLELINSKACKVMKRVGEMLGIKTEEVKVVSVTNEEDKVDENPLFSGEVKSEEKTEEVILDNPFLNDNLEVDNVSKDDNVENPLFSGEVKEENSSNNDMFSFPDVGEDNTNNDFWFPSDMPDALNELPDLDVPTNSNDSNNFFASNDINGFDFPDLNLEFDNNDMEGNN